MVGAATDLSSWNAKNNSSNPNCHLSLHTRQHTVPHIKACCCTAPLRGWQGRGRRSAGGWGGERERAGGGGHIPAQHQTLLQRGADCVPCPVLGVSEVVESCAAAQGLECTHQPTQSLSTCV
jgi:hypothetical protein